MGSPLTDFGNKFQKKFMPKNEEEKSDVEKNIANLQFLSKHLKDALCGFRNYKINFRKYEFCNLKIDDILQYCGKLQKEYHNIKCVFRNKKKQDSERMRDFKENQEQILEFFISFEKNFSDLRSFQSVDKFLKNCQELSRQFEENLSGSNNDEKNDFDMCKDYFLQGVRFNITSQEDVMKCFVKFFENVLSKSQFFYINALNIDTSQMQKIFEFTFVRYMISLVGKITIVASQIISGFEPLKSKSNFKKYVKWYELLHHTMRDVSALTFIFECEMKEILQ